MRTPRSLPYTTPACSRNRCTRRRNRAPRQHSGANQPVQPRRRRRQRSAARSALLSAPGDGGGERCAVMGVLGASLSGARILRPDRSLALSSPLAFPVLSSFNPPSSSPSSLLHPLPPPLYTRTPERVLSSSFSSRSLLPALSFISFISVSLSPPSLSLSLSLSVR